MYVISGKGTVAGADLAKYILNKCQQNGVQWDSDLPQYTIDFCTQIPSISKSIRDGKGGEIVELLSQRLDCAAMLHDSALILCVSAQSLIPKLNTKIEIVNLWDLVKKSNKFNSGKYAFLGTAEAYQNHAGDMVLLANHDEKIGDLITSVKRGYGRYSEAFSAHPKNLLAGIVQEYKNLGIEHFFIACTDLHVCSSYLAELDCADSSVMDIIEIVGDEIIDKYGRVYNEDFLDLLSDQKSEMRYKYLEKSDSLFNDEKAKQLDAVFKLLPGFNSNCVSILDIGSSSTGNAYALSKMLGKKSNITIHDISEASIKMARRKEIKDSLCDYSYVCGDISAFSFPESYDIALCLGVLLFLSSDSKFEAAVSNFYNSLNPSGTLITRDGVYSEVDKYYLDFGGVVRNEAYYDGVFESIGFVKLGEEYFIAEFPIRRKIKTVVWGKPS